MNFFCCTILVYSYCIADATVSSGVCCECRVTSTVCTSNQHVGYYTTLYYNHWHTSHSDMSCLALHDIVICDLTSTGPHPYKHKLRTWPSGVRHGFNSSWYHCMFPWSLVVCSKVSCASSFVKQNENAQRAGTIVVARNHLLLRWTKP